MKSRDPSMTEVLKTTKLTSCPLQMRLFVETIYDQMFNDIYLTAAAFFSNEADDIVQDFILKLLERKHFNCFPDDSEKHLRNFIMKAVVNMCRDRYKKKSRQQCQPLEGVTEFCSLLQEKEDHGCILDLNFKVQQLPPRQKEAFLLYHFEGYQKSEIASLLETSSHGVVNLLCRAKKSVLSA